ncbi:peptide ABC transporter permease [Spirochaetia bacterium]|nr:peptide ABC transporter permease [Spirochaetia bacterium]
MKRYILKRPAVARLFQFVPVFFGVTALVFFLLRLAPGDAAYIILQDRGVDLSAESLTKARSELGLDKPVLVQYGSWLKAVLKLDLGNSVMTHEPVLAELSRRFRMTLMLTLSAMALVALLAFPLGVLSAVYQGKFWDTICRIAAIAAMSVPAFCAGLLCILLFSVHLKWLPSFGAGTPAHLVMPCFVLAIGSAAHYTRLIRSALLEELSKEYVRTARARGVGPKNLIYAHAMKNALLPVLTSLGMSLAMMLGGAAVVEKVFSWPGLGMYLIDAVARRDYPVVQGCVLLYAFLFTFVNLAVDILCIVLDPRVRRTG